jgi:hypothetical protein
MKATPYQAATNALSYSRYDSPLLSVLWHLGYQSAVGSILKVEESDTL